MSQLFNPQPFSNPSASLTDFSGPAEADLKQATEEAYGNYTVKRGDTLFNIAKQNNLTLEELLNKNKRIKDPNKINIGQRIFVPDPRAIYGGMQKVDNAAEYITKHEGFISVARVVEKAKQARGEKVNTTIGHGHLMDGSARSRKAWKDTFGDSKHYGQHAQGIGSLTLEESKKLFEADIQDYVILAKELTPNFDNLSPHLQNLIISETYRGGWGISPKTRELLSQGKHKEASKEFLNSDEYRDAEKNNLRGLTFRYNDLSKALATEPLRNKSKTIPIKTLDDLQKSEEKFVEAEDSGFIDTFSKKFVGDKLFIGVATGAFTQAMMTRSNPLAPFGRHPMHFHAENAPISFELDSHYKYQVNDMLSKTAEGTMTVDDMLDRLPDGISKEDKARLRKNWSHEIDKRKFDIKWQNRYNNRNLKVPAELKVKLDKMNYFQEMLDNAIRTNPDALKGTVFESYGKNRSITELPDNTLQQLVDGRGSDYERIQKISQAEKPTWGQFKSETKKLKGTSLNKTLGWAGLILSLEGFLKGMEPEQYGTPQGFQLKDLEQITEDPLSILPHAFDVIKEIGGDIETLGRGVMPTLGMTKRVTKSLSESPEKLSVESLVHAITQDFEQSLEITKQVPQMILDSTIGEMMDFAKRLPQFRIDPNRPKDPMTSRWR